MYILDIWDKKKVIFLFIKYGILIKLNIFFVFWELNIDIEMKKV